MRMDTSQTLVAVRRTRRIDMRNKLERVRDALQERADALAADEKV